MFGVASGWIVITSAPAFANASTCRSGRSIIRCTSTMPPRPFTRSRIASTISGPIVIGGTKCPSITSTCITRAPASITSSICSPRREKSAESSEGAIALLGISVISRAFGRSRGTARQRAGRHGSRVQRVPLPGRQPAAHGHLAERARFQLLVDRDPRLQRHAEAQAHGFLDRAVRPERQRLGSQVVLGEELADELAGA